MRVDSHHHLWKYDPRQYPWITDKLAVLRKDFLAKDLEPALATCALDGSVVVQAQQILEEARWLLQLADETPFFRGVVGWVDLCSESVEESLIELSANPKFVGVRHVVQDEPDDHFLLREDFQRGIAKLATFDLTYDILIYSRQLPAALELVRRFPQQPFVLDHLAKPSIRDGVLSPWSEQIRELARCPNVSCKISGMVTESNWKTWQKEHFRPYLDVVFEAFGEDRVMFGSDWPVCLLAASYEEVYTIVEEYAGDLSRNAKEKLFGGNAARFYGIPDASR